MHHAPQQSSSSRWIKALLFGTIAATLIYFFAWDPWHGYRPGLEVLKPGRDSTLGRLCSSWDFGFYWRRSWFTVLVMAACMVHSVRRMKHEPVSAGHWGLPTMTLGLLLHAQAIRSQMVPFSVAGLALLNLGGMHFTSGWRHARLLLFPLSLTLLLVPSSIFGYIMRFIMTIAEPADRLAMQLFLLMGGGHYGFTSYTGVGFAPFIYFLPTLLIAVVIARYAHRTVMGRLLLIFLSVPVTISAESLRLATRVLLMEKWPHPETMTCWNRLEFPVILVLSAGFFLLACRLTGGIGSASWRAARSAAPPPAYHSSGIQSSE